MTFKVLIKFSEENIALLSINLKLRILEQFI